MTKYAKLINEKTIEFPPKNKDGVSNYDLNIPLLIEDGYKEFVEAEKQIGVAYDITYKQTKTKVKEIATPITPDPAELLKQAKEQKILENDTARDIALNQGVNYKGILFDSDTDQKANIIAMVFGMDEEQTVTWFGMDNQALECTKEDLENIGGLIIQLHSFCWTKNAMTKDLINNASTVEEVEAIVIDYTLIGEDL